MSYRRHLLAAVFVFSSFQAIAHAQAKQRNLPPGMQPCDRLLSSNPLLNIANKEDKPFDYRGFSDHYFIKGLPKALANAKARLKALRETKDAPTFENTIVGLIGVTDNLDPINLIFDSYLSMKATPKLEKFATSFNPRLAKFSNSILFDPIIFARVKSVYDQRAQLKLTKEQSTLLENTYRRFVRNGALLGEADKKTIDEIDARLTVLTELFKQNLNKAIATFTLRVTDAKRLAGIKGDVLAVAKKLAESKGEPNAWHFTLLPGSVSGIMNYAEDRSLREEMWRASAARAASGSNDNRPLAIEIAQLRQKRAKVLGYATHAHYTTEERMAQNPDNVLKFIERLKSYYRPAAEKDLAELEQFAASKGHQGSLMAWDTGYYSEQLSTERYSFDSNALKAYFPFDAVLDGALKTAGRLFNVEFIERKDLSVWHPTVRAFQVRDSNTKAHIGYYYNDPYSRPGKRPGAWMTATQEQGFNNGRNKRPHILNVLNLTPPTADQPSLLSIDDVRTVFHELGHGLHGLLTQGNYRTLTGTNVAWDFVELPSQLNELWAMDPQVMQSFARHYKTGEVIPLDLIEKVRRADTFQAGLFGLRQIRMGALDMTWYTSDVSWMSKPEDVQKLEEQIKDYSLLPTMGTVISPAFAHIFSGGYSAGYYSYKWADVLVADAFELFEQKGLFDEKTAGKYRRAILEMGGKENAAILYRRFRGRDADPEAMLRREGLIPKK